MINSFIDANCTPTRCTVIVQPLQYSVERTAAAKKHDTQFVYRPRPAVTSLSASPRAISVTKMQLTVQSTWR